MYLYCMITIIQINVGIYKYTRFFIGNSFFLHLPIKNLLLFSNIVFFRKYRAHMCTRVSGWEKGFSGYHVWSGIRKKVTGPCLACIPCKPHVPVCVIFLILHTLPCPLCEALPQAFRRGVRTQCNTAGGSLR